MTGLTIIPDYITEEEESILLSHIKPSRITIPKEGRNSVKRYGSKLPYPTSLISQSIPAHFLLLIQKLADDGYTLDSVTVNEYKRGQSISYHIDSPASGPVILVLSLLSSCRMGMRRGKQEQFFEIEPRTLVKMEGEARDKWQHCILPVKKTRFSIVFRKGTK